ncbi:globin-coupled sensor protein [Pelagibacterium lentulum]|uniref:Methyl-accepting chemotaxis protein n=1 Tax=Pelagibacterium lentulum TaxID=2029865 RepID=A0A916RNG4_9HYPH|nr:globin-coupled sensor protein [Pelagibacterium lentulum]GGA62751.1 methyl-accepting chemotaxis protein [Pelagibacterium lentulum]
MTHDAAASFSQLQTRLDFIGLDAAAVSRLQKIQKQVDLHLPKALDRFYDKIATVPDVARFFSGKEQMNRAQGRQVGHWKAIASGKFDSDYLAASTKVGLRHAQIGLEPRWYIGGYGVIVETLVKNVVHDYMAEQLSQMRKLKYDDVMAQVDIMAGAIVEIIRAIMIDIDIAVSTYFDKLTAEAERVEKENAERINRAVTLTGDALRAYANGDLTVRIDEQFEPQFQQIKDDTNAVGDKLSEIVGQLRVTSNALKTATSEILSGANDLSERTTKQAATIEETSAAMEQLAQTVMSNAKNAEGASIKAQAASRTAEDGGRVMTETTAAMERITTSSSKVSDIIGLIDNIAFQTNLLALNASVEAARAGEAGKGFAVVAIEVRRLAQSAAQASQEVKALVEQSNTEVETGSKLVADASSKLVTLLEAVKENAQLLETIAQDSKGQASSIEEINAAVRQMDEMTQHNAALVEETNAAIEQTENQANQLDSIVEIFVLEKGYGGQSGTRTLPGRPTLVASQPAPSRPAATMGNAAPVSRDWDEF